MDEDLEDTTDATRRPRLMRRLDSMVASGRVTDEEAARLRAASSNDEFDEAVRGIRLRHAQTRLDTAVEGGDMTREDADGFIARLGAGEHPRSLRAHLGKFRPRRPSPDA